MENYISLSPNPVISRDACGFMLGLSGFEGGYSTII
jgi:hypothetical protein